MSSDRYDIATEVLSSAIRVLLAVGFSEGEIPKLFEQVSNKRARVPLWIEPL
jgi:DNA-binding transcriptional regulator YhcF (GntR family)